MVIELRKKAQITIPKEIVSSLNLKEGDHLDVSIKDGIILIEPVALYSKSYVESLEKSVMMINEEPDKYTTGPFKSVEDAIAYLESENEETPDTKK